MGGNELGRSDSQNRGRSGSQDRGRSDSQETIKRGDAHKKSSGPKGWEREAYNWNAVQNSEGQRVVAESSTNTGAAGGIGREVVTDTKHPEGPSHNIGDNTAILPYRGRNDRANQSPGEVPEIRILRPNIDKQRGTVEKITNRLKHLWRNGDRVDRAQNRMQQANNILRDIDFAARNSGFTEEMRGRISERANGLGDLFLRHYRSDISDWGEDKFKVKAKRFLYGVYSIFDRDADLRPHNLQPDQNASFHEIAKAAYWRQRDRKDAADGLKSVNTRLGEIRSNIKSVQSLREIIRGTGDPEDIQLLGTVIDHFDRTLVASTRVQATNDFENLRANTLEHCLGAEWKPQPIELVLQPKEWNDLMTMAHMGSSEVADILDKVDVVKDPTRLNVVWNSIPKDTRREDFRGDINIFRHDSKASVSRAIKALVAKDNGTFLEGSDRKNAEANLKSFSDFFSKKWFVKEAKQTAAAPTDTDAPPAYEDISHLPPEGQ